jgi:Zn ribbon nucleic-acid-binding protein
MMANRFRVPLSPDLCAWIDQGSPGGRRKACPRCRTGESIPMWRRTGVKRCIDPGVRYAARQRARECERWDDHPSMVLTNHVLRLCAEGLTDHQIRREICNLLAL